MYGCESWTIKKVEHWRTDAFELWCWRILLRVPWTARRSNQSTLKAISPEYSLEGLMLKLKLQYFGHLIHWLTGKDPDARQDWRQEEKGTTEDEMAGWHHQLDGHESEQAPAVGDGEGSLACCSPWCLKDSDRTEWLNRSSLVAQVVKNPLAMQETQVRSLDQEDPLHKGIATHSRVLSWKIPWTEDPGRLQLLGRTESDTTEPPTYLHV